MKKSLFLFLAIILLGACAEDDIGSDAVALGKATLECDEYPNVAKITFLTSGLFTVTVEIYNENEEQLGVFTCQPYVL